MRTIEGTVCARCRRSRKRSDEGEIAEARGDAKVLRLATEKVDDLTMAPEEGDDERRAAVTTCRAFRGLDAAPSRASQS